jgi:integrase
MEWKGWHAFRRGLASNLYGLGIQPLVIAAILRHGDISTTLQFYTKVPESASKEALQKIDEWLNVVQMQEMEETELINFPPTGLPESEPVP